MATAAPKVRDDLEYFEQVIDGDEVVLVRDPIRNTYFRYNLLQAAMLRALDGRRTAPEITAVLSAEFDVEIPPEAAERFVARARELMLLDITSYSVTPHAARTQVRKALRAAGFAARAPRAGAAPRALSAESMLFAEAFRQLDLGHPRAAASYLAQILARNPTNARAKQLYDLIQTAYIRAAGGMTDFPTWVLFDPSRLLTWMSQKLGRFLFSWLGVLAILAFVCAGAYAYSLISFASVAFGPLDLAIAITVYTLGTLFHEIGHGLACQHYGGNVTEIGFTLFYYVKPAAYCDTSSSYTITSRRHKMIVQMGGTIASLIFIAAHSITLALLYPSLPIYPGLALALAIETALAFITLVPFMKFDGYYAICDYVGFPNLRDRSFALARAWLSERLLGITQKTEALPVRTRRLLIAYALASFAFTAWFIYVAYFRLLAPFVEHFRGPGLVFAVVLTGYLLRNVLLWPVWGFVRLLVRERRTIFTLRRTAALLAVALALVAPWFVRWPVLVDGEFVVVPHARADVRARTAGRVVAIHVREGDRVVRGQPLATLRNVELSARIAALGAELEVAAHRLAAIRAGARPEERLVARRQLDQAQAEVARSARDAAVARQLAAAAVGTRSRVDTARGRLAADAATAGSARWALALLDAGARPEDVAVVEAEHARLAVELARLRSDEALLTLRSPIDGVVATAHLEDTLQAQLAPGELFAEVHDHGQLVAEIALTLRDPLAEISPGDAIELRAYGLPAGELHARVARIRETAEQAGGERRVVVVTTPFTLPRAVSGLRGHARIYGAERTLAYAHLYLPLQRLIRVQLWSMW